MIKAIIFDFGGVLIIGRSEHTGLKNISYLFVPILKLPHKEIYQTFLKYWKPWKHGKITKKQFWSKFAHHLNIKITNQKKLDKVMINWGIKNTKTVNLAKRLKKNYKIAILSNHAKWWFEAQAKRCKIKPIFNIRITSYDYGIGKPNPKIYKIALKKLGVRPEEAVFIDDIRSNAEAATKLGMHGCYYTSYGSLLKFLKNHQIKL